MIKGSALITGASSGIGCDFARVLAAKNIPLVLVARREDRLLALKQEIQAKHNVAVEIICQDLSSADAAQKLFATLQAKNITVDILINNAGFGSKGDFVNQDPARLAEMIGLNITTLTFLTRLFAENMKQRGHGHILQVSSIGAFQPSPYYAVYSATKAYVLSFSEAIHHELKAHGVFVTTLYPGMTSTEFLEVANHQPHKMLTKAAMTPALVAAIGIKAMFAKKSAVVAGATNQVNSLFIKFLPRSWATRLAAKIASL